MASSTTAGLRAGSSPGASSSSSNAATREKTICAVCQIESDNHHIHYGALACFSCRAFFRRAHNKGSDTPTYACKKDGKCDITNKNRKKCQRCRYDACLKAGMNPHLVLTDEQKKVRFRKMLEKKGSSGSGASAIQFSARRKRVSTNSGSNDDDSDDERGRDMLGFSAMPGERREHKHSREDKRSPFGEGLSITCSSSMTFVPPLGSGDSGVSGLFGPAEDFAMRHEFRNSGRMYARRRSKSSEPVPMSRGLLGDMPIKQEIMNEFAMMYEGNGSRSAASGDHDKREDAFKHPTDMMACSGRSLPRGGTSYLQQQSRMEALNRLNTSSLLDPVSQLSAAAAAAQHFGALAAASGGHTSLAAHPHLNSISNYNPFYHPPPSTLHLATGSLPHHPFFGRPQIPPHLLGAAATNPPSSTATSSSSTLPSTSSSSTSSGSSRNKSDFNISSLISYYDYSISTVVLDRDPERHLISFQYGDTEAFTKADLRKLLICFGEQFRLFSMQISQFTLLPFSDQRKLLSANTPIFVQYILARYFAADNGSEQLHWLLGHDVPELLVDVSLAKVSLATFNRSMDLFSTATDLSSYENLLSQITKLGVTQVHNPLVATLFLFMQSENTNLSERVSVQKIFDSVLELATKTSGDLNKDNLEKLIDILLVITEFYCKNITWNDLLSMESASTPTSETPSTSGAGAAATSPTEPVVVVKTEPEDIESDNNDDDAPLSVPSLPSPSGSIIELLGDDEALAIVAPQHLAMPYTVEEEAWLNNQLVRFKEVYEEISLGEELVNEFVMYSYDVPLSKHFVPSEISAFVERCRRIMKIHPEFEEMSDRIQNDLYKENLHKAAALCSVKAESHRTGSEQLQFCFGSADKKAWEEKVSPLVNTKIKKVLISDWNRTTHAMDTATLLNYLALTGNLATSVEDLEMFKIITLMSLFSGKTATSSKILATLEKKYATLLQRRAANENSKASYAKIRAGLESVDELAKIFDRLQTF